MENETLQAARDAIRAKAHRSAEVKQIVEALVKAQAAYTPVEKKRTARIASQKGNYEYSYADLADIMEMLRPILAANGLAISHSIDPDGELMLTTRLYHTSGEWISTTLPVHSGGTPQALGSNLTYMRRYSVAMLLGVVTEDDEDAQGATIERPPAREPERRPNAPQRAKPPAKGASGASPTAPARIHIKIREVAKATGLTEPQCIARTKSLCETLFQKSSTKDLTEDETKEILRQLDEVIEEAKAKPEEAPGEDPPAADDGPL